MKRRGDGWLIDREELEDRIMELYLYPNDYLYVLHIYPKNFDSARYDKIYKIQYDRLLMATYIECDSRSGMVSSYGIFPTFKSCREAYEFIARMCSKREAF